MFTNIYSGEKCIAEIAGKGCITGGEFRVSFDPKDLGKAMFIVSQVPKARFSGTIMSLPITCIKYMNNTPNTISEIRLIDSK